MSLPDDPQRQTTTAVLACGALAATVRSVATRRGWPVDVHPLPALLHNRPEKIAPALTQAIARISPRYDTVAVAYGDCGSQGAIDAVCARAGVHRLAGADCYDVFAREEVAAARAEEPGTYFLTDFLARTFEHTVVRELGLDRHPELRDEYFRHYRRVLWLAQRPTPATERAAQRAAERIGLPLVRRDVGDAGLERRLASLLEAEPAPTAA